MAFHGIFFLSSGAFVHEFKEFWVTRNKLMLRAVEPTKEEYKAEVMQTPRLSVLYIQAILLNCDWPKRAKIG